MDWIKLTVRTTTEGAEVVCGMFMGLGIDGAMIEDVSDIDVNQRPNGYWDILGDDLRTQYEDDVKVSVYIPEDDRAASTVTRARAALAALRETASDVDLGKLTLETGRQSDEDWAENWKSEYKPFRLGEHFVIKPTWEDYDRQPGDRIIDIDPGMAFGSGTHETTGLCTMLIEKYVRPGQSVCDVGTGTGILAMAAALMGAHPVKASDIDPMAVRVARENVALNGLDGVVEVAEGDLLSVVDEPFDCIVANIIADVIVAMARGAFDHLKPGGLFICSGIATERRAEVESALSRAGFDAPEVHTRGEWVAMAARRPGEARA
ncbi:MAG: 50S ribosomal protein L11 methyltransferase [Clostridia bacterium]|nr:50S ribosomal protein L11 methyltransferase [Clostridia bacterium]